MEEQALYRGILSTPHDDTARLVYADWLDENAERFPDELARSERARAEFIRIQCALARLGPGGWKMGGPSDAELAARQKRLLFRCGSKWRRWVNDSFRTAPFDRGFLRPFSAMRPQQFLSLARDFSIPFWPLAADSPARRYLPGNVGFDAFPLWDVHLYASDYQWDDRSDRGQYGDLLAEVASSPALERVGWLKVSFLLTPVFDFLRTGHFANVETLMLNSGPFPAVLEAIAENESFRSLRYVLFGGDWWAWAGAGVMSERNRALLAKITDANQLHLPHGKMRDALCDILGRLPPRPPPVQLPLRMPDSARPPSTAPEPRSPSIRTPTPRTPEAKSRRGLVLLLVFVLAVVIVCAVLWNRPAKETKPKPVMVPAPKVNKYDNPKWRLPEAEKKE